MFAFLDTPFDRDYPVYTRANAGEILPDPVTPLAWSVIGPGLEEGFRISLCDDFSLLPRPGHEAPYKIVGRMAGRFHLNLTAMRMAGDRLPGTSAQVVDLQYLGDAVATGLPAHQAHADDRRYRLKAPPSMGRTLAGIGRRIDRDRAMVDELTADHEALDPDVGGEEMVRMLRRAAGVFGVVLGTHVTARALTSPILEQAVNALGRSGIAPEDALRYVASIPDLESARPSRALAEIARTIPADSELAHLVDRASFAALAASDVDGAPGLHDRLVGFLDAFGHRGIGEFDPTNPAWGQRPDDVVTLLGRLRGATPHTVEAPDVDPGRVARPLVAAARSAMARGERTKDTCMRSTNLLRTLLLGIRARLDVDLTDERFSMCTLDELEARTNGAGLPLADELDRRAAEFAAVAAAVVGEWSDGSLSIHEGPPDRSAPTDGIDGVDGIAGSPGSPGVAKGRVRVIDDPYQDFDEGDILVATMTDTAWTPLFLVAGAVVTDVGGVLSHGTIVARDLGIPAVVNTKVATVTLHDGDLVRVDGSTGQVTVLERA